jgi:hypothetical protein
MVPIIDGMNHIYVLETGTIQKNGILRLFKRMAYYEIVKFVVVAHSRFILLPLARRCSVL